MPRKVLLLCCIALAYAGTLGPAYSPATAISYSSIRFGSPTKHSAPIEYAVTPYDSLFTEESNLKTFDENQHVFKTLDTANRNIKRYEARSNDFQTAPIYTERSIFLQHVPSESRVLSLIKPILASRNIPQAPSPDFDSVPSVLKTEGLSAYASFPIKISATENYSAPIKKITSPKTSVVPTQAITYTDAVVRPGYYSAPTNEKREGISTVSLGSPNQAQVYGINYSETPVSSHVSVSNSGTNYSW